MGIPKSEKNMEELAGEKEEKGAVEMENIDKDEKGGVEEMEGREVVGEGEKKTVMVAVNMDAKSKETLTWSLVNLAHSGDHFVACHVINTPGVSCSSLNSELDSMLSVYEGFCNLKQVLILFLFY
jgi:hypothetical protein